MRKLSICTLRTRQGTTSHPVKPTGCSPWALNLRRRGILVVQVLGVLLWCAGVSTRFAAAQDRFDPAALAKTIAPVIEEQTVAVTRIDITRIALDPLFEKAANLFPDLKVELPLAKLAAATWREAFSRAGGRDVYAVITLAPMKRFEPVSAFLVVPLRPGANEKALQAAFQVARLTAERVGDVLVAADNRETLEWVRKIKPDPRPELAAAFEAAGDATVQLLLLPPKYARRVIEETMPMLPEVIGGGSTSVFTRGAQWAAVGVDLPPRMAIRVVAKSQDVQAAEALRARWLDLLRQAGKHPEMPRFIPAFDQVAKLLTPTVEKDRLVLVFNEENKGIPTLVTTILQPAIRHALGSAARAQSANQLKQIGMAMHMFHDARKRLPAAASYGPDGKPLLSWRVHILPYFEHNELYKQFRLNEPWDSPHNKTLIEKMPPVYRSPASKLKEPGRTNYVVAAGPGTVFSGREGMSFREIVDGTSATILTVEVADEHAVIWTKPEDLPYDPKDPAKGLGGLYEGGFNAGACDGAVHFIPLPQPAETLRHLFDPADIHVVYWP
jgi:hypothetical protein